LISTPTRKVAASSTTEMAKPMMAMRRMFFGACSETMNMIAIAGGSIIRCRFTK
jgi:hypothetical protein